MPSLEERIQHATPSGVCGLISEAILKRFGDVIQNAAEIDSSHGYYYVKFWALGEHVDERMRRKQVADFIKRVRKM